MRIKILIGIVFIQAIIICQLEYRTAYLRNCIKKRITVHKKIENNQVTGDNDKEHPNYWVERSWENCLRKKNIKCEIAFYGNSIIYNSDFTSYFPDKDIINLGVPGENIEGLIRRIKLLECTQPKKIFIMIGINNIGEPTKDIGEKYDSLLCRIKETLPHAKLYVHSILPINHTAYKKYSTNNKIKECNFTIAKLAKRHHITYIDLYSLYIQGEELPMSLTHDDGIHLKPQAYDRWAENIRQYIYE